MIIKIKNLKLRTIVGIYEWEKKTKQDIVINVEIEFDGSKAIETDNIEDTVDYKTITKKIIAM
ncbi:MAG: FolB domain-containing protein, partial [Deltaproteobacteria bacterium]|nr:FolB domain-containing protein [Deltaproteobacteria bacterium]